MDFLNHSERELLHHIARTQDLIMADLTKLQTAVEQNTAATQAAVTALNASTDQPSIDAAAQQIAVNTASLSAALNPPPAPAQPA